MSLQGCLSLSATAHTGLWVSKRNFHMQHAKTHPASIACVRLEDRNPQALGYNMALLCFSEDALPNTDVLYQGY